MNRREFLAMCAAVPLAATLPIGPNVQPILMAAWKFDRAVGAWYCEVPDGETITGMTPFGNELYVFTERSVYLAPKPVPWVESPRNN